MMLLSSPKAYRTYFAFTQPQVLLVLAATAFVVHLMDVLSGVLMMDRGRLARNAIALVFCSGLLGLVSNA